MTDLGLLGPAVEAAVAATLLTPGWVAATLTRPGGAALGVRVFVLVDEQPQNNVQRHRATILVPQSLCPEEPVDGTTIVAESVTWTARTALEQNRFWRVKAWANG